jgi:outer membrane protein OmpA-like peptidoglycan-associated protein
MLKKSSIILSALLISSCSGGTAFNRRAAEMDCGIAQYQTDGDRLGAAGDQKELMPASVLVKSSDAERNSMDQSAETSDEASAALNTAETDAQQAGLSVIINFEFDSYEISNDQHPKLDALVNQLGKKAESKVSITGYTDDVGRKKYNDRLAKARASEIARYLIDRGKISK